MNKIIHMQGDIQLEPCSIPKGEKVFEGKEYIVAWGEVTGHAHRVKVKDANIQVLKDSEGQMYLFLGEKGELTHEEHGTHELTPGWYKIGHEREHDYFQNESRRVID